MRVLVNGLQLSKQFSGVQYYLENFLRAFSNIKQSNVKLIVLLSKQHNSNIEPNENLEIYYTSINGNNRFIRIIYENAVLPFLLKRLAIDILFCPSYILPLFTPAKSVIVVHDLIALDFPELCSWTNANYFRYFLPHSIKKANKIITGSLKVKTDILSKFDVPHYSIADINHGIPPRFKPGSVNRNLDRIRDKYSIPEDFILFVGNIEPKKNIETLIDAFTWLNKQDKQKWNIVLVGQLGWKYNSLLSKIQANPFHERIHLTGYIDEEDLPGIYNLAQMLVLPSFYEGYGYPVLEAMACSTPVICSTQGALQEISGGNCLFTHTESPESIARCILQLKNDSSLRESIINKGLEWSKQFTTQKSVHETIKVFRKLKRTSEENT